MTKHEAIIFLKGMQKAYNLEGQSCMDDFIDVCIGVVQEIEVVNPM